MIHILGSRGRLGRALAARHQANEVNCVDRSVYEGWSSAGEGIAEYFSGFPTEQSVIYVCSGLLDPRLPAADLFAVNYTLPRNVIEQVTALGMRVVTFGTAMEHTLTGNSYVQSKRELGTFVSQANAAGAKCTHIRIHTQFGSEEPSPFMFLGQVLNALRNETPFAMTQGRQLREYHHVDDDAAAIASLIDIGVTGCHDLSHGQPVTLKALAEGIFEALGKPHLLQVGALPEPAQENFDVVFEVPELLKDFSFRETHSAVADYMTSRMNA